MIAGALIAGFANIASDWSVEDFSKILFDVGGFGFVLTGSLVAMFWGTKVVGDARADGAVEVELATPIGRSSWLIGKFIGISLALILLGALLLVIWQAIMLLNHFGWMTPSQLRIMSLMIMGWLVTAASAVFFSSFAGQTVAVFCTFCAWLAGLAVALVSGTLTPDTSPFTRSVIETVSRVWDLQQFNAISLAVSEQGLQAADFGLRTLYGAMLISVLVTGGCMIFARKDLIN